MDYPFDWTQVSIETWLHLCGAALFLGLTAWLCSRLPVPWRGVVRFVILLLALRVLLFRNPVSWHLYETVLQPIEVGWRQASVIRKERDRYLARAPGIRYLAVGSSQTDALYSAYAKQHDDFATFTMAAMAPLDFVLYRDYIARYRPRCILLYLSDFDIARQQPPESVAMAPRQGLHLIGLWAKIRSLSEGDYDRALTEMLVGELSPEFKYGFLFRALTEKTFLRIARSLGRADKKPPVRSTLQQRIQWLQDSISAEYTPFNMTFLCQFLAHARSYGAQVVIVEGQYNPAASNATTLLVSERVRSDLQELATAFEHVQFLPRTAIYQFSEEDYQDLSHVTLEAASAFAPRLVAMLDSSTVAMSGS